MLPGRLLLALAAALVNRSLFVQLAPSLSFFYIAVFAPGLLLACCFISSRLLFSLLLLLLAHRAIDFFSNAQIHTDPGHAAAALAAFLIPLNFISFAERRE